MTGAIRTANVKQFFLSTLLCVISLHFANAQDHSLRVYVGKEISGDHIFAHLTIGAALRVEFNSWLYLEPFLRVGYGSLLEGKGYPKNPGNYTGKFQEYVFEQSVRHEDIENGLKRQIRDADLLTVIHGYQIGAQKTVGSFNGYIGAGISIGYMDYQTIIEAGDALFDANGQQYLIWYSIPTYQRGLGLQMSFSTGMEKQWSNWSLGLRGDLDFGSFGLHALGTRMSVSIALGIPL